jgi:hypothetical protein
MKVYASKPLPAAKELAEILNQEFSGRYSSRLYGLGSDKTIMVRESTFVGAQISIRENEITVQGVPSQILTVISMTELAVVLIFFLGWVFNASWKKLEREIAVFLHHKYN